MKIDVTQIEGYEAMSAEEKLAALEQLELPAPDLSGYVLKDTADKYATEAAALKKQLRERMTAEEAEKTAREEQQAALREELEALRRERAVEKSKGRFLELGLSPKLANSAAEALTAGELDKVFDAVGKFKEELTKQIMGELLKDTQRPPAGGAPQGMSLEAFKRLTLAEKSRLAEEQPEVYQQMTNGGT